MVVQFVLMSACFPFNQYTEGATHLIQQLLFHTWLLSLPLLVNANV